MINKFKLYVKNQRILFFFILFVGVILRFYNLNWGAPFYFHPDERQNIAYPIQESKSLLLRDQKNFDINPFPLIVIKNTYKLVSIIQPNPQNPIESIIIIARYYGAVLSILISVLIFFIGKKLWNPTVGLIAFTLSIFSTGLIQYAHFGTIELWEGLILLLIFFISSEILKNKKIIYFLLLSIVFGIGVSTKFLILTAVPVIVIPFVPIIATAIRKRNKANLVNLFRSLYLFIIGFTVTILVFFPQLFFNIKQIEDSLKFESTVATGKLAVFFTQGFTNTTPVLYQTTHVLPFLLNPVVLLLSAYALIYLTHRAIKERSVILFLLIISFIIPFISTSILFVKWTRYMIPLIPFIYILTALFLYMVSKSIVSVYKRNLLIWIPIISSIVFSISFFITVYLHTHTAIEASLWFKNNHKHANSAISEPYDIGITPFNALVTAINFVDFYNLDSDDRIYEHLTGQLSTTELIILPSQRLVKSRIQNSKTFPRGYNFYSRLLSAKSDFKLVYKTPCDTFCRIAYVGDPIFANEETVTVFDRPTVFIFKNNNIK